MRKILLSTLALLILAAAVLGVLKTLPQASEFEAYSADFTVTPSETLTFPIGFKMGQARLDGEGVQDPELILGVYIDAEMKVHASEAKVTYQEGELVVTPRRAEGYPGGEGDSPLFLNQIWSSSRDYYLKMEVNPRSGQQLKEPILGHFSVEAETLRAPEVSTSINERGHVELHWEAVEGADKYLVTRISSNTTFSTATTLAVTDKNSWVDMEKGEGYKQNAAFQGGAGNTIFGVVAVKGESSSTLGRAELDLSEVPVGPGDLSEAPGGEKALAAIPSRLPVVMADGSVQERRVLYDGDSMQDLTAYVDADNNGQTVSVRVPAVQVSFRVEGTDWTGSYRQAGHSTQEARDYVQALIEAEG